MLRGASRSSLIEQHGSAAAAAPGRRDGRRGKCPLRFAENREIVDISG
jgi:hypothetical protein